MVFPKMLSS